MNSHSTQNSAAAFQEYPWGSTCRILVSVALAIYLFIVVAAPATHPVSNSELTEPVAKALRPIHQAFYLGHGYRFFAPDPGPSHIVRYSIKTQDGDSDKTGQFPDRRAHWPRLLYHRWFMLSENLFSDSQQFPDPALFERGQREVHKQIGELRQAGRHKQAEQLQLDTEQEVAAQKESEKRINEIADAIGQHLLRIHDGQEIQISLHERGIPLPQQVAAGDGLDDPRQVSPPIRTWVVIADTETETEEINDEAPKP